MDSSEIILSNRTKEKGEKFKKNISRPENNRVGETPDFDLIISATSLGLKEEDEIKLNYSSIGSNKFFYDVIYNPRITKFLSKAKEFSNQIENGKYMFVFQAQHAFLRFGMELNLKLIKKFWNY